MKTEAQTGVGSHDLLGWLRIKLDEAESSLRSREQMEQTWRSGNDELWRKAATLHGGRAIKKAERLREAEMQRRIAVKCRREVKMFKAVVAALDHPNDQGEARRSNEQ